MMPFVEPLSDPISSFADSFLGRQFVAAGLAAVAAKVAASSDLDLDEALALSRAGLPLLGRLVQLRPAENNSRDLAAALPVERVAALPESPRRIGQRLADWESFCRTLIALRGEVSLAGDATFWYPIVGQPFDRELGCDGGFTGAEVLRAIALARLVLPAEIEVLAPLATLGPKLAQVALDFGASRLGYVALEGQTSDDPLLADPSLLEELLESISKTEINAPPTPMSAER
jgi:hypothetical protein